MRCDTAAEALRRLARLLAEERGRWLAIGLCSAAVAAASVALAWLAAPLSRALAEQGGALGLAGLLVAVAAARGLASHGRSRLLVDAVESTSGRLRLRLHAALAAAELRAVDADASAELGARLAYEVEGVRGLLYGGVAGALHNALLMTALGLVLAWADPLLAAAALLCLPLVALAVAWLGRASRRAALASAEAEAAVARAAAEGAALRAEARAYGAEPLLAARYADRVREAEARARRAAWLALRAGPLHQLLAAGVGGALLALAWARPGPAQVTALAALALLYGPARSLATTAHALLTGLASLDRLGQIEALPRAPAAAATQRTRLCLEGVDFAYGPREVLRDLAFEARVGQLVAVVGDNGAGKSTLLRLLAGLTAPARGSAALAPAAWVPADPHLLEASLLDNVAFGASPEPERARAALEAAGAGPWLEALPAGLSTPLAPSALSSGQRQRVALARALYRDRPFLLLDEPCASLDAASEAALLETLASLAETRGVVFTSHRPSLVARAERVLRLEGGRLSELAAPPRAAAPGPRRAPAGGSR